MTSSQCQDLEPISVQREPETSSLGSLNGTGVSELNATHCLNVESDALCKNCVALDSVVDDVSLRGDADEASSESDGCVDEDSAALLAEEDLWEDEAEEESSDIESQFYHAMTVEMSPQATSLVGTLASMLAFLSPGTALFLGGRHGHAVAMNVAISVGVLLISVLSVVLEFFPVPLYVSLFVWVAIFWGIGFCHTFRFKSLDVHPLEPWVQASLAILSFWLPFACCFYVASECFLQRTWMSNDTMKPSMLRGDLVLVDKHAYWFDAPKYGDLVLIEESYDAQGVVRKRAYFGRVIARPKDRVQLQGVQPSVNGQSLVQYHRRVEDGVYHRNIMMYELPYDVTPHEAHEEPKRWYPVFAPNQLLFSQTNTITLEDDYYYVLEDNREAKRERARSTYGSIVHRDEIKGQPRYILYNTEDDDIKRYGLRIK